MYQNVIPPSDGESSDEEVFQTFLQANNLTKIYNAEYQPPTPNAKYSQLATVQISPTPCRYIFLHNLSQINFLIILYNFLREF